LNQEDLIEHLLKLRIHLEDAIEHIKKVEKHLIEEYHEREKGGEGNP